MIGTTSDGKFADCQRMWQAYEVWDLGPKEPNPAYTFGSVLHLCAERYLLGVDGIVPDDVEGTSLEGQTPGDPVELFPEGWLSYVDRDGRTMTTTKAEGEIIRTLIHKGIDEGVLFRMPEGVVEEQFWIRIRDDIWFTSLMDYYSLPLETIVDHKTARALGKPWVMTDETISKNRQLSLYAKALIDKLPASVSGVHVRHNQFEKDLPNRVRAVNGFMERGFIEEQWSLFEERALQQFHNRKSFPTTASWDEVPQDLTACQKYRTCDFYAICLGAAPIPLPPSEATEEAMAKKDPKTASGMVPWANESCACCPSEHKGLMPNGAMCPLCMRFVADKPELRPTNFDWGFDESGRFYVRAKDEEATVEPESAASDGEEDLGETPDSEAGEWEEVDEASEGTLEAGTNPFTDPGSAPDEDEAVDSLPDEPEAAEAEEEPVEEEKPKKAKKSKKADPGVLEGTAAVLEDFVPEKKRGPQPKGMILCIDCAPGAEIKGYTIHALAQVAAAYQKQIPHYYERSDDGWTFRRKELLAANADEISRWAAGRVLIASRSHYELNPLVGALKAHAQFVFEGTK